MSEQVITDRVVNVTPAAVGEIKDLLTEREMADCALRVFVTGGGCSGMQYGMAFEPNPQENDVTIEAADGVRLVVDPVSRPYLQGANIDFIDSIMGGGFKIENPNAVSTCGCGTSFRTSGDASHAEGGACGCH